MDRASFHKLFKSVGPVVLPVIHVVDAAQVARNIRLAVGEGAAGVFLINHDFSVEQFLPIIRATRESFDSLWLGVNFLAVTGDQAFPVLAQLQREGCQIDAYWGDDACIDEHADKAGQERAIQIARVREESGWNGLYLGGTCFKKQREVAPADYPAAATMATHFMDCVCTSGVATGQQADLSKIQTFRQAIGDTPLALASGITPDNAAQYRDVDCFMVATGISAGDFYNLDPGLLNQLMSITHSLAADYLGNPGG